MNCEACRQLLEDFIDGDLPGTASRNVEQHIRECGKCSREAEFLRGLSRDAAALPKDIQPDKDLWPAIESEIKALCWLCFSWLGPIWNYGNAPPIMESTPQFRVRSKKSRRVL
jgi:hypothetical protein